MPATSPSGSFHGLGDIKMVLRQVYFEQLSFWLNPLGAFFTIGFSTIFLIMLGAISGHSKVGNGYGNTLLHQYYLGAFLAYGIMSACYTVLAQIIVNRREMGLLKRLRLSPIPTWALLTALFLSTILIALLQIIVLMAVGALAFGDHMPAHWLAFFITVVVGMVSFTALAMGVSTLIPNMDSGGPIISIVFFLLLAFSGLWFPVTPGTTLAQVSGYFPVRHLITAVLDTFNLPPGSSVYPWHDLLVMALWGLGGVIVAARRWQWAPRRG
jgi:ABC-2 type transport system permease protein